ncbi:MAG: secondary thiamine-phosphate synthase enzyme YjbQ [Syntrophales bacterium]|jgi:secondary thiamine-phosphate synthase enzyme|nr:secondary thiamine-phosphate synthase enzyme YjbQ [Syntrophales bacterium]MDD4338607.1 secondary thiamine-phosphate synthase enzyme YjbQ [Syntrophales bacterium]HOG07724.1 secondary thiamine-phosphate synthase enzyme YjbQ [Syntrophales bacterium]HOS78081.1 secondary thiamine-phosphate synthase enzyme YjbQ [Syntrophales bacterium]HQN26634.1 secondary thiamine-phosphate synthase enzyme YjbQ [Syntrophales bacterium]
MNLKISNSSLSYKTSADTDIIDITTDVAHQVGKSGLSDGQVLIFVPGSTAAVTTIEYESGVVRDLKEAIERLAPTGIPYRHDARWGDGNGYAHVRAALLGPSLGVPLIDGRLVLGTWQQIVLIDFDNEPRDRKILVSVSGY